MYNVDLYFIFSIVKGMRINFVKFLVIVFDVKLVMWESFGRVEEWLFVLVNVGEDRW